MGRYGARRRSGSGLEDLSRAAALALDRFCKRTLEDVELLGRDTDRSPHARYLDVYRFLRQRDDELARAFNDPRCSHMIIQLTLIQAYGLLEPGELERFTARTRATIEYLAAETLPLTPPKTSPPGRARSRSTR